MPGPTGRGQSDQAPSDLAPSDLAASDPVQSDLAAQTSGPLTTRTAPPASP